MAKDEPESVGSPLEGLGEEERTGRRAGRAVAVVAAVLVVIAAGYVGACWSLADTVPRGTKVAGVEIGGLGREAAVSALVEGLRPVAAEPIEVRAGEGTTTIDPAEAGLALDAEATVEELTGFSLEPARLWQHVFGLEEKQPVTSTDRAALGEAVAAAAASLATEPVDGRIVFADGAPHVTEAVEGLAVDEPAAVELLEREWLTAARPVELPTRAVAPAITQEETRRALDELARPLASGPVGVVVDGQVAELPVRVLTGAATIAPSEQGRLELSLDGEQLVEEILARTRDLVTKAKDARFEFVDGRPRIVPGRQGTTLDPEHVAEKVREAALGQDRTAEVELTPIDPEQSEKELEKLGITELVASFDTPLTNDAVRTRNLVRGAELVTGVLVRPGEVFSLNETIGPVSAENGYFEAGVVVNGRTTKGMGGGLSQMGTTMFNAAYFAGFEDVEHRPHTYWYSRYPEGREATIYEGVLDVKWKNTTPYGALLNSYVKGGRLYVEVWGTKHFEVESFKSGRSNVVQPRTTYSQAPGCEPQAMGSPGFTVTNTRVLKLDGVEVERKSFTWTYRPQDAVVCGRPPSKDKKDD